MVSQRRLLNLLTMLILLTLFAVACERPLGGTDDGTTDDQASQTDDPNAGGGTDNTGDTTTDGTTTDGTGDTTTGDTATDDTGDATTGDATTDDTGDTTTDDATTGDASQDDSDEAGGGAGDTTTGATDDQTTGEDTTTDDTATGDTTTDDTSAADSAADDTSTDNTATAGTIPATHTVVAGENLYRIGLKYGISWVAIANANNLTNPNILTVGQVLNLPTSTTPTPGPTPSPQTETTYVVQTGDNLFRIGLKFGISWVQIAEANGLVNPNVITVGDELKIPVDTPGPAPTFSHVVKPGETLFLISLQYGVSWPSIAEANNLTSPYVIYVGQTLEIPGS